MTFWQGLSLYLVIGGALFFAVRIGRLGRRDRLGMFLTLLLVDLVMTFVLWLPYVIWSAFSTTQSETEQNKRGKGF